LFLHHYYLCFPLFITYNVLTDENSKELTKVSVKFLLHSSGHIAAKFQYDQVLILHYFHVLLDFIFFISVMFVPQIGFYIIIHLVYESRCRTF
jgi:phage shock protein PspC (stress-responsive transcriptional regulator)